MAVLHVAYTFRPRIFLEKLKELVVADSVQYERLLAWAEKSVAGASEDTHRALEMIRYDPDLLANARSNPREYARELFMVALVSVLTPVTSLGTRQRESYYVLQKILPHLGWERQTVERLVRGDSLDTLVQRSQNAALVREFCNLRQFGGWLDHSAATSLRGRITAISEQLLHPQKHLTGLLAETAGQLSVSAPLLLERAYHDANGMLQHVSDENLALFLVLD